MTIIGIIAALTIPSLISKYQKAQFEAGFKKAYSEVNQISRMIKTEYSDDLYTLFPSPPYSDTSLSKVYKSYLKVADKQSGNRIADNFVDKNGKRITYKNFSNTTNVTAGILDDGNVILADGRAVIFDGGFLVGAIPRTFMVTYDTNGINKGPNRYGYDLFSFILGRDGAFYPAGSPLTADSDLSYQHCSKDYINNPSQSCSETNTSACNGIGCAQKAATDANYFKKLK